MDDLQEEVTLSNLVLYNDRKLRRERRRYVVYVVFSLANSAHPQGLLSVTDSSS